MKTICQHIPTFSVSFADSSLIEGGGEQSEPEGVKKNRFPPTGAGKSGFVDFFILPPDDRPQSAPADVYKRQAFFIV